MAMYMKNKDYIYKVRFTKEQDAYIKRLQKSLNCSKSDAIRFIIDTVRLGENYENKQTNFDHQL